MDLSNKTALKAGLDYLAEALQFSIAPAALRAYLDGRDPEATGYEKLVGPSTLPTIGKYMLVAESYLAQPNVGMFYDIFRAARIIPLVRALHNAINSLRGAQVAGLEQRLCRLVAATDLDVFEAILFELIVAARYGQAAGLDRVEFVPEQTARRTPDLRVRTSSRDIYVECKRIDRMTDAHVALRNEVRTIGRPVLAALRRRGLQAVVQVTFKERPGKITVESLEEAVLAALGSPNALTETRSLSVKARPLRNVALPDYALHPSPAFFWNRYGYRSGDWHGLVHSLAGVRVGPSFLDSIAWDSALMWRIENEDLLWSIQRLPFTRFFDGIEQLAASGSDTALHVWFERSPEHGHRREFLLKLSEALATKSKAFAWIIANETLADISIGGRFDFQEHASGLGGLQRPSEEPLVASVFVDRGDIRGVGEWGVGLDLPPIDDDPFTPSE